MLAGVMVTRLLVAKCQVPLFLVTTCFLQNVAPKMVARIFKIDISNKTTTLSWTKMLQDSVIFCKKKIYLYLAKIFNGFQPYQNLNLRYLNNNNKHTKTTHVNNTLLLLLLLLLILNKCLFTVINFQKQPFGGVL